MESVTEVGVYEGMVVGMNKVGVSNVAVGGKSVTVGRSVAVGFGVAPEQPANKMINNKISVLVFRFIWRLPQLENKLLPSTILISSSINP